MKSPDEFENVENFPYSSIVEVPEVVISGESGGEAAVLPDDEGEEAKSKEHENWDVGEGVRFLWQESFGIIEEEALEF